ncbi:MAG: hypothetical protein LUH82_02180 [Clostridiales bacterium]|nr:hypothetical protein [Clostridiales bacterium]
MCLIITTAAAIIATLIWRLKFTASRYKLDVLSFMYWGAAIMWSVDSIYSSAAGEGFFDMSANDACLGTIIVLIGIAAWAVLFFASKVKAKKSVRK